MSLLGVFAPRRFVRLVAGDALNITRDPMLLAAIAMSFAPALLLYLAAAQMNEAAHAAFGVEALSRLVAPLAICIPAFLVGWVTGFLLLEDRDEGTLLALDVTPVGKGGFLAYRVSITAVAALAITLYAWPLAMPWVPFWLALSIAVLVALEAVAGAVVLPAIARNKVEGLALTKLTNLAAVVALVALVPSPLRYVAGVVPTYWIGELLGLGSTAALPLWLSLPLALLVHVAVVAGLFRMLARKSG